MHLVKTKQVDEVIVTRIDRLGRSLLSCRKALDVFRESDVKLTILDGSIDLSTVAGRTHANMMAVWAEMESEMISERSRHGWDYLRKRRVAMHPPFGYIKVNDRHELDYASFLSLLENKQEMSRAAIARDVINIFFEARSLRATIKRINTKYGLQRFNHAGPKTGFTTGGLFQWSTSGLQNWLTNPVLWGHLAYLRDSNEREQIIFDTHPEQRLITDEESREIQKILDHNRSVRGWGFRALRYPLSGLIFCAGCGGNCYSLTSGARGLENKKRDYYYFQCKNYRMDACSNKKSIRMDAAEEAVVAALTAKAQEIANLAATPTEPTEPLELKELRSQIAALETIPGRNSAIEQAKVELRLQIDAIARETKSISAQSSENRDLLVMSARQPGFWNELESDQKKRFYQALIDRVVVKDGLVQDVKLKPL